LNKLNILPHEFQTTQLYFEIFEICIQYYEIFEKEFNNERKYLLNIINYIWSSKDLSDEQFKKFIEIIIKIKINDEELCKSLKSYLKLINYNLDLMKLHFDYTLNGLGYEDAKKEFILQITKEKNII